MKHSLLLTMLFVAVSSIAFPAHATSQPNVSINAILGQSALLSKTAQRTYLRITIKGGNATELDRRTPVNLAIVIDTSGSMKGQKLQQAKEAAIMAVNRLAKRDTLSVVAYSDGVNVLVPSQHPTQYAGIQQMIKKLRAQGRTALYAGVKQGVRELQSYLSRNRVNRVILISDGLANIGPSTPTALGKFGREVAQSGISITTIGLGLGYNEDLMSKLAFNSDGNHAFVEDPKELVQIFNREFGDILSVVGQDVEIEVQLPRGVRPMRSLGRTAEITGNKVVFRLNQIYGSQEKHAVLELEIEPEFNAAVSEIAKIGARYTSMKNGTSQTVTQSVVAQFTDSPEETNASVDRDVMETVVTLIATEENERAVRLRDRGRIEEAKKLLEKNATYLDTNAAQLESQSLIKLRDSNLKDARGLSNQNWNKTRKAMRAKQFKDKTQQSYQ
ncbi:MAG: vWA domain-containing protein [Hyphomicrobiaceae bacterium]